MSDFSYLLKGISYLLSLVLAPITIIGYWVGRITEGSPLWQMDVAVFGFQLFGLLIWTITTAITIAHFAP